MVRMWRRVMDKRVLRVIRRYLQAGAMLNGVLVASAEGTPQGGPLSPLLADIMLDDLDKLLEERGHRFCRYADDCNVYVRSQRAGERTMSAVRSFVEGRLGPKLNEAQSKVDRPCLPRSLRMDVAPRTVMPLETVEALSDPFA